MKSLFKVLSTLIILLSFVAPVSADVQSLSEVSNAFQVTGDLPFANNAGAKPARLAIGTTGQVLVVGSNGFPSWASGISSLTGPVTLNPGPLLIPNALSAINQGINLGISAGSMDIGTTALQIFDSAGQDQAYLVQGSADVIPARLIFAKSRKTDGTADTIVANADVIGRIRFMGADGAAFRTAAQILASVDGAPGSSDMPGSLDFQVTPDGSATAASALKLSQNKAALFGGSITTTGDATINSGNLQFGTAGTGYKQGMGTLAAAGSTQADAAAITQLVTRVTGANGTTGVFLPTIANYGIGMNWYIINADTTNALKVYAFAAGQTITGQSGTTAVSVAAKGVLHCINYDQSANWYCDKPAAPY